MHNHPGVGSSLSFVNLNYAENQYNWKASSPIYG